MNDYVKPSLKYDLDHIIIHVGTNDLRSEKTPLHIANEIIQLASEMKREAINTHRTDVTENCGKLTNVNNSHTRNRCHRELRKINECQHRIRNSLNR